MWREGLINCNLETAAHISDRNGIPSVLQSISSPVAISHDRRLPTEKIAPHIEAENRLAKEMAKASEVQRMLFPRRMPPLETLDYAGNCEQAGTIGGDFYDFVDMGGGRVGFVLADVSGKGVSAALLMANLQASLRSKYALALEDLPGMFRAVNKLFCESATQGHFATLFFADYSDTTRKLRYVNCGHEPALLVHANGTCNMLKSTATALGLFEKWHCAVGNATMAPGDTLVMYSDGVTEASDDSNELFGYERLLAAIQASAGLPASDLLKVISTAAHNFSGKDQEDDLTLLVARVR